MDEFGIHAQVLYPNVAGFGTGRFLEVGDAELMLACVQAYNDFLVDYGSRAPDRFVPIAAVPFWDVDASVQEIERAATIGHKGIVVQRRTRVVGPAAVDRLALGPDLGRGAGPDAVGELPRRVGRRLQRAQPSPEHGEHANFASIGVQFFLGNAATIAKLVTGGVCHRFPGLDFVSVESGVGWLPFVLEALDWQWKNCGVASSTRSTTCCPSEYFQRQIYGCFWFEEETVTHAIELLGPDNFMYETDFPHPTSMTPGPASAAEAPRDYVNRALTDLPDDTLRKLLHDNAARVYHLDA